MIVPEGESKEFLGSEFLTWLWYYGENNDWTVSFPGGNLLHYGMDEMLVLQPDNLESCSHRLTGPIPIKAPEAEVGLQEGKKITATRVIFVQGENEWSVTLRGDRFQFSSLKLMPPTTADVDDRFAELSEDLERVVDLFDKLYEIFLSIRLSSDWKEKEIPAILDWIKAKQK